MLYYLSAIRCGLSDSDLRGAYLGLGSTYRALGRYEDSRNTLLYALQRFPNAVEVRVFLAMALHKLRDSRQAVASLLDVIAETTSHAETRSYAAAIRQHALDLDRTWE